MTEKIERSMPASDLIVLNISSDQKNKVKWIRSHEILFESDIYDVIKTETSENGSLKLFCYNDKKEKEILTALDKFIKANHDGQNDSSSKSLVKALVKDYFPSFGAVQYNNVFNEILFSNTDEVICTLTSDTTTPPPKQCV